MYQFFVEKTQIDVGHRRVLITGSDVNHIKNVLRMKPGEELSVCDGEDSREYRCGIMSLEEERVVCEIRFIREDGVELPARIHLFQALPKADKMEWIIRKAVELGVYEIIPVSAARCIVRLEGKKEDAKLARWNAIAEAAAKQSRRGVIPRVSPVTDFGGAAKQASQMDVRLIPYELSEGMKKTKELIESVRPGQDIAVMIGPEGGFEEKEIALAADFGITPVTLGRRILRTETAGLAVAAWLMYQLETE